MYFCSLLLRIKKKSMNNYNLNEESFSSFKVMAMLFRKKWLIILVVVLSTAASVVISLNLPLWYKSTISVVPPKGDDSGGLSGSIGSALKDFGLKSLGGAGGAGGESYDFLVILQSRSVIDSIIYKFDLAEEYKLTENEMIKVRKAFMNDVEISYEETGNYLISIWNKNPQKAADIANNMILFANRLSIRISHDEARLNTEHLESRFQAIEGRLRLTQDTLQNFSKEYMMFSPEDQAKSISDALSELKLQEMQYEMTYTIFKERFGENDAQTREIGSILKQTKQKIDDAQNKPGFAGNFSISEAAGVGLEYVNYLADLEALTQMKAILLPMIEEAKYDEVKNIENLYVVDEAIPADKKDRPKRSLIVLGTCFGSFVFIVFLILVFNALKEFRIKLKSYNEENSDREA
ncbi:MAG: hypothetical protein B7C24_11280 [Bacteroidetes bacterium 4572_77]|nr:MAG: hypothetical protein B7C24_11280 [Bacteroidetes bacterium 4572_77]